MAHRLSRHSILALGLLASAAGGALAQGTPSPAPPPDQQAAEALLGRVSGLLDQAAGERRRSRCQERDVLLHQAEIEMNNRSEGVSESAYNSIRRLFEREVAQPCGDTPPGSPPGTTFNQLPVTPDQQQDIDVRSQQRGIEEFERPIAAAEAVVRERRCLDPDGADAMAAWAGRLRSAGSSGGLPPATAADLERRARAAANAPCAPPLGVSYNSVQIAGGYGDMEIPRGNYGFVRDGPSPAPERPAAFSQLHVPVLVFEGSARILGFGDLFIGYAGGDASNRTAIAASTTGGAAGTAYTDNAQSGSTGVSGTVAETVDTDVSVDSFRIAYEVGLADLLGYDDQSRRARIFPYAGLRFEYLDLEHRGTVSITTPVTFTQQIDQSIKEIQVGAVVGLEAVLPIGSGAEIRVGAEVGVMYYDADGHSNEAVTANFGADRNFTTVLEDDMNGASYTAEIRGELIVDLNGQMVSGHSGLQLVAGGGGEFLSRPHWVNPSSGNFVQAGGTSFLDTDSVFDWRVTAGLRYAFGQPPQRERER